MKSAKQVEADRQRSREWHEKRTAAGRCHSCSKGRVEKDGQFHCIDCKRRYSKASQKLERTA